jgi:septal ring-binding cell division protein DamX
LDFAGPCREQFVEWISARAFTMSSVGTEKEPIEPDVATDPTRTLIDPIFQGSQDGSESHPAASLFPHLSREEFEPINPELGSAEEFANDRKSSFTIVVALALVLLSSVLVFLVYHSRAVRKSPQPSETTAPAEVPILLTNDVTAPEKPSTTRTPSSASSARLDLPGFVLQVGAMKQEANADALAQVLRKKNFPAFVFMSGADSFYRVAVGPYRDEDSAVRVKGELQKDGFKTFSRRWVPE